jgi:Undecaprenyl-phosphate glucose phosphotransferase
MRVPSVEQLQIASPGLISYFVAGVRILHGLTAIIPGMIFLLINEVNQPAPNQYWDDNQAALLLFFALLSTLTFQAFRIYNDELFSNLLRFRRMFFCWLAAFSMLAFLHQQLELFASISNQQMLSWFLISLFLYGTERLILLASFRRLMRKGFHLQNAVILGATDNGLRLANHLTHKADIRCGLLGFIDDRSGRTGSELGGLPILGNTDELERLIRQEKVAQVLVALPWSAESRIAILIGRLRRLPVNVMLAPDLITFRRAHSRIGSVAGIPMFNASELPLRGWSPLIKRVEDLLLASIALILLTPLMLLTILLIKLDSPGPVLFRQHRYGYNNRLIDVFKFRSMHQHAHDANAERQTTRNDERITRVGRFIRKTSIDELPQLLNVLRGNMSMVGPRPHATATKAAGILFEDAVEEYSARHRVKPGITGWAQINGYRGETDTLEKIERRVELDLEYIERWSVWLDLYILFRTLPAVALTKEVY